MGSYINLDGVYGKRLSVDASPVLRWLVMETTKEIVDPATGRQIPKSWNGAMQHVGDVKDYAVFINHLGISSINLRFDGHYGLRDTVYDNVYALEELGDGAPYISTLAQLAGLLALRLADEVLVPYNHTFAAAVLTDDFRLMGETIDPVKAGCYGGLMENVHASFQSYVSAAETAKKEVAELQDFVDGALENMTELALENFTILDLMRMPAIFEFNKRMADVEKAWLGDGLKDRRWYKHVLHAPDDIGVGSIVTWPAARNAMHYKQCSTLASSLSDIASRGVNAANVLRGPNPAPDPLPFRKVFKRIFRLVPWLMGMVVGGLVVYCCMRPRLLRMGVGLQNRDLIAPAMTQNDYPNGDMPPPMAGSMNGHVVTPEPQTSTANYNNYAS